MSRDRAPRSTASPSLGFGSGRAHLLLDLVLAGLIFFVALGPRLEIARSYDQPPQSEEELYNRYALPWSRGEGVEPREQYYPWHPFGSFTHRPPGYALFLGSVYRMAGPERFDVVRELQAWMDAGSMVLIYLAGLLAFGGLAGRVVGLGAALLVARYDFLMLFVARLLSEPLYLFLGLLFVCLALAATRLQRPSLSMAAGISLGLANITRPFLAFVLPGYLLWLLLAPRLPGKGRHLALALLGMLVTVGPVTHRNWEFHERFILISTNSGYTLYKSLTEAEGLSAPEDLPNEESIDALELGEVAEQAAFRQAAIDYMRAHPEDLPTIYGRKLRLMWDAKGGHRISHELMVTPDDEWLYHLVLIGALLGLLLRPSVAWHPRLLILGCIASQYLVSLVANAEVRYRVPIVPLLALLAAWFVWGSLEGLWQRWRDRARPAGAGA